MIEILLSACLFFLFIVIIVFIVSLYRNHEPVVVETTPAKDDKTMMRVIWFLFSWCPIIFLVFALVSSSLHFRVPIFKTAKGSILYYSDENLLDVLPPGAKGYVPGKTTRLTVPQDISKDLVDYFKTHDCERMPCKVRYLQTDKNDYFIEMEQ